MRWGTIFNFLFQSCRISFYWRNSCSYLIIKKITFLMSWRFHILILFLSNFDLFTIRFLTRKIRCILSLVSNCFLCCIWYILCSLLQFRYQFLRRKKIVKFAYCTVISLSTLNRWTILSWCRWISISKWYSTTYFFLMYFIHITNFCNKWLI